MTDEGRRNVFRVCGRDDQQGTKVADHLAVRWAGKEIAILDDGTTFGAGLANAVRRRLHERGVRLAMDDTFIPGESDYSALVSKMQTAGIDVFFVGALHRETGLIFRQAQDRGYDLRLVAPSSSATGDFPNQRVGRKSKDFCGSERPVAARGADLSLTLKSAGPRVGPLHTHQ